MRVEPQTAYVIHRRPYRETSALIEIITAQYGRVGLIARGIHRKRSDQANLLQPIRQLKIGWSGRGELMTLHKAEPLKPPLKLVGGNLFSALYINELVMRITARNDPNARLFDCYDKVLHALVDKANPEQALRRFEKRLLDALGYGLNLSSEGITGRPIDTGREYTYEVERGATMASHNSRGVQVHGATLLALNNEAELDAQGLFEAKHLMRHTLRFYIGDQPLAARMLFQADTGTNKLASTLSSDQAKS